MQRTTALRPISTRPNTAAHHDYAAIHQQTQSPPSCLLQMPNEILEAIITATSVIKRDNDQQFLGWRYPEHQYTNLKSVALTCRRLHQLCVPYLWRDKEYILPREDDEKSDPTGIHTATDVLSRHTLHHQCHLGAFVRSLSRDLTNGRHYDMRNSQLLAQLVCNLRALRIDFHPKIRTEHYGLQFFAQYCSSLSELYLENCRDTHDDFKSLLEFKRPLVSLTLISCTIKEDTLVHLIDLCKHSLTSLLFLSVFIEAPSSVSSSSSSSSSSNITEATLSSCKVTPIPHSVYQHMFSSHNLTQLALSDPISHDLLQLITLHSPMLQKLALVLGDFHPFTVTRSIIALTTFSRLSVLSLAFRQALPQVGYYQRIPCCAPASAWTYFIRHLPFLRLVHISASRLLLSAAMLKMLVTPDRQLPHVMLHHVAWVPGNMNDVCHDISQLNPDQVAEAYIQDVAHAKDTIDAWRQQTTIWSQFGHNFLTYEQASSAGFSCFDTSDRVCFVKGFDDWKKR